ncbi:MAG: fibronectin type III domain-containing protein [Bdellovibrionota bacterium]
MGSFKKRSWLLKISAMFVVTLMLFAYQNCAQPFSAKEVASADSSLLEIVGDPASINLAWDASLDANNVMDTTVTGYKVYIGTAPGVYGAPIVAAAGATPSSLLTLEKGKTYYFAVTAVNAVGSESDKSAVLSHLVPL